MAQNFTTKDRPLSETEREELDKLKVKDLREAVISAHPEIRSFLEAEQR